MPLVACLRVERLASSEKMGSSRHKGYVGMGSEADTHGALALGPE